MAKALPDMPEGWTVGTDREAVKTGALYDLKAMPSLYLLDGQKRVLLKDVPYEKFTSCWNIKVTNQELKFMQESHLSITDFIRLTPKERSRIRQRYALHRRYEAAVELYAETDASVRDIAVKCGESEHALRAYLRRYWRELMLRRHGIETGGKNPDEVPFYAPDGRTCQAHEKYKDAVQACDSLLYIDLNLSQVARKFGQDGTALANYMRVHYPEVLSRREAFRVKLGINDNIQRGVRPVCREQYAAAVELYRTTDMSVKVVAAQCSVSEGGFCSICVLSPGTVEREERNPAAGAACR